MGKMMKFRKLRLIVFIMLFGIGQITFGIPLEYGSVFNVLILNSYQIGHRWEEYVMSGFTEAAEHYASGHINIKVEYLDFRNRNDEAYLKSFREFIEKKYPSGSIDAIYAIDDEGFSTILAQITDPSSELYHVPLFFSGVDASISLNEEQERYITGIYQRDVTLACFNLIMQLDNTINYVNIVTEQSGFGDNLIQKAGNIIEEHLGNEVVLNVIQSDYIEEVVAQLKARPSTENDREIILMGGEFQTKETGAFLDPVRSVELIREVAPCPIYTNDPTYLPAKILGGCMDIGEKHGEAIFNAMRRMIEGESVAEIESRFCPSPENILKYDGIYEHNIDVMNIPRKCTIMDKKFYQLILPEYIKKTLVIIRYGLMVLLLILTRYLFRKYKEIKVREKEAQLREAREKMQTDFVVNMSHELRTPINIILTAISVIKIQLEQPSNEWDKCYLEAKLQIMTQNAYRLLKISNNIIDMTKIESEVFPLNKQNHNIVEVVEAVFCETIDYASKKDITMVFDTSEEDIVIGIDQELIQRVVLNLLSNAIKFTLYGGEIYTRIKRNDEVVIIEIEDTGIGIHEERLEIIFERFYQVDSSLARTNEGSGIGLCIAKKLITLHDGRIEVTSTVGKGTCVQVLLPARCEAMGEPVNYQTCINTIVSVEMADVLK